MARRLWVFACLAAAPTLVAPRPVSAHLDHPAARVAGPALDVVEVTATNYALRAPDSIASGWTTLRLHNLGTEHHFIYLTRLPNGRTFDDYVHEAAPAFDSVMTALRAGMSKPQAGALLGKLLPAWYLQGVTPMGGVGLVAPGKTAQATVRLEPGTYVMECYVKAPNGAFHGALGMVRPLVVTSVASSTSPPASDLEITLSNAGIDAPATVSPGRHTFAVHYREHPAAGLGNDVHVVRLRDDSDLAAIDHWLDWMNVGGLRAPAPAQFVGGVQEMPVGSTAYFTVDLTPGRYAFVSEGTSGRGMQKVFTVER